MTALILALLAQDDYSPNGAKVRSAVDRGLEFLANQQRPNGSWRADREEHVAATAVASLALMAGGSYPDRGKYAENVAKALDWILSCQTESGYITAHGSRMYEHGFATLFLAEVMGMTMKRRKEVAEALHKSVALYVQVQASNGGWRYQPAPNDADMSLTVVALQALRAARNRGIEVPKETIERGMAYVRRCEDQAGGFHYQPGNKMTYNLTAGGLISYYSIGITKQDEESFKKHFEYLKARYRPYRGGRRFGEHFYYGNYYAAQACYQRGGEYWDWYWSSAAKDIIDAQFADGHWEDDVHPNYATAMACVILQLPREYIPVMQK